MKTAISIPDALFDAADRLARRLGVSRSQLYAKAAAAFLERNRTEGVTEKLNEIYGEPELDSRLDPVLASMQWASLAREEW